MCTPLVAWMMWFFLTAFYAYQYVLRVLTATALDDLTAKFNVGALEIGNFSGIYYIGYVLAHLPIGVVIDRMGPKKVLPVFIILTFAGLLPLVYVDNWTYSVIGRLITGIASSASVLGLFKVVNIGFGEKKFSRMIGMSVTIGLIGAINGGTPISYLLQKFGFENVINALCIFGAVLAIFTYFSIPKNVDINSRVHSNVLSELKSVLLNPRVLYLSFFGGLMIGPLEGFADAWGPKFLQELHGLSKENAGTAVSFVFLGMCFGCPMLTYIAEKLDAFYGIILISACVMLVCFILIFMGVGNVAFMHILLFVAGFFSAYQILIVGKVRNFTLQNLGTITSAVANMVIMIFGYVFHSAIGIIIHKLNGSGMEEVTIMLYGLSTIPMALMISILGMLILLLRKKQWGY